MKNYRWKKSCLLSWMWKKQSLNIQVSTIFKHIKIPKETKSGLSTTTPNKTFWKWHRRRKKKMTTSPCYSPANTNYGYFLLCIGISFSDIRLFTLSFWFRFYFVLVSFSFQAYEILNIWKMWIPAITGCFQPFLQNRITSLPIVYIPYINSPLGYSPQHLHPQTISNHLFIYFTILILFLSWIKKVFKTRLFFVSIYLSS